MLCVIFDILVVLFCICECLGLGNLGYLCGFVFCAFLIAFAVWSVLWRLCCFARL